MFLEEVLYASAKYALFFNCNSPLFPDAIAILQPIGRSIVTVNGAGEWTFSV